MKKDSKEINVAELVLTKIDAIIDDHGSFWIGTMTNLMVALNRVSSKRQRALLPGSPSALRMVTNKIINRLRNRGISVRFTRTPDHARNRLVRFAR